MLRSSFLLPDILRQLADVALPASTLASHTPVEPRRDVTGSSLTEPKNRLRWADQHRNLRTDSGSGLESSASSLFYPRSTYMKRLSGEFGKQNVRLLRVLPGNLDDYISCDLEYASLVSNTPYEAVSYCWGNQLPTVEISCDGKPFMVTENLAAAIRTFRLETRTILLWADAICINQEDVDEKNCQVPLMRQIYERASAIRVWLGPDEETKPCDRAFSLLGILKIACLTLGWSFNLKQLAANPTLLGAYNMPDVDDPTWRAIGQLIQKPWFGRAWIIQEIAVSREAYLHCGSASIRWTDFYIGFLVGINSGLFTMRPDAFPNSLAYQQVIQLIMTCYCFNNPQIPPFDLPTLLESHRLAGAVDSKDKIYALLGLCDSVEGQKYCILPDYSLPAPEVYTAVAKVLLEKSSTLDLLGIPKALMTPNIGRLPSWVPDWSTRDFASSLCFKTIHGRYHFSFDAAKTSEVPKHSVIQGNTLELSGQAFDQISKTGRVMDPFLANRGSDQFQLNPTFAVHILAIIHDWAVLAGSRGRRTYPTGEDIADVFARTLYLNDFSSEYTMEDVRDMFNTFSYRMIETAMSTLEGIVTRKLLHWSESNGFLLARMTLKASGIDRGRVMIEDLFFRMIQRRMVVTEKGYIGIAPRLAKEGDCIVLVKGGRVPLILRPEEDQWELLGDCYVHGIMRGDAFDESKCTAIRIV
ncbi:uncharacterized protein RCO7_03176 [Rhynchosporium graminicola]|uniref:Heterokaryon incompatibility domain-containing protein n=1 Tax=Rhynchosporium graminicola TaxID=2792576 RepID=A0A1E1LHL0_9HELO|nr:uncharacterized protein RCO7_03176 [Rhynchosporium commune]